MKKLKLYFDASSIGRLDEPSIADAMNDMHELWRMIKVNIYDVVISQIVLDEINAISESIKRTTLENYLNQIDYEYSGITDEMKSIANMIIHNGILTQKSYNDCIHIACAIIRDCDCIVSYNFRHLKNVRTIHGVRAISNLFGYGNVDIFTAKELIQKGEHK